MSPKIIYLAAADALLLAHVLFVIFVTIVLFLILVGPFKLVLGSTFSICQDEQW